MNYSCGDESFVLMYKNNSSLAMRRVGLGVRGGLVVYYKLDGTIPSLRGCRNNAALAGLSLCAGVGKIEGQET